MKFRDLRADEIDVRIGQVYDGYFTLLLYKDARVDMDVLDEACCIWTRRHYEVKGNLFCSVGIWNSEVNEFVFKDDCGTESNTEKEKGEASDSFKRACFNWGIGRELYTSPPIKIKCDCKKSDSKNLPYKRFSVKSIEIIDKQITALEITACPADSYSKEVIFSFPKEKAKAEPKKNKASEAAQKRAEEANEPTGIPCDNCGNDILATANMTAQAVVAYTREKTKEKGKELQLCSSCFKCIYHGKK